MFQVSFHSIQKLEKYHLWTLKLLLFLHSYYFLKQKHFFFFFQKVLPAIATYVRNASDSTDLKAVLNEKVPKEQERVKNFRKAKGSTVVGEVTVDMVSLSFLSLLLLFFN